MNHKKIITTIISLIFINFFVFQTVCFAATGGGDTTSYANDTQRTDTLNESGPVSQTHTTTESQTEFDTGLEKAIGECSDSTGVTCFDRGAKRYVKINQIFDDPRQDNSYLTNQPEFDKNQPIETVIIRIINYMLKIIGTLCVFLIIVSGAMMVSSAANEEYYNKAKEIITGCVIGLVLAFSSYIIVNFVEGLFF